MGLAEADPKSADNCPKPNNRDADFQPRNDTGNSSPCAGSDRGMTESTHLETPDCNLMPEPEVDLAAVLGCAMGGEPGRKTSTGPKQRLPLGRKLTWQKTWMSCNSCLSMAREQMKMTSKRPAA